MQKETDQVGSTWKSWVPTVLGNLSFSLTGRNGKPFRFIKAQHDIKNKGCVYQKRIPFDIRIPGLCLLPRRLYLQVGDRLQRWFYKERFFKYFFLVFNGAEDENSQTVQKIEGAVFAFTDLKREERKKLVSILRSQDQNLWEALDNVFESIGSGAAAIKGHFILDRQGFCELNGIDSKRTKITKEEDVANQLYYFIRDVFHTHKHHDKLEERLTHVYEVVDSDAPFRWTDGLIKDLLRYLIRHREEKDYRVLGIFPYLETLTSILSKQGKGEQEQYLYARMINLHGLKESIKTNLEQRDRQSSDARWFLSIVGMVLAIVFIFLYQDVTTKEWIIGNQEVFWVIVGVFVVGAMFLADSITKPWLIRKSFCFWGLLLGVFSCKGLLIVVLVFLMLIFGGLFSSFL